MKRIEFVILLIAAIGVPDSVLAESEQRIPIIFDTDFVMPPADDGLAIMLALQSPELEILGVTTVYRK